MQYFLWSYFYVNYITSSFLCKLAVEQRQASPLSSWAKRRIPYGIRSAVGFFADAQNDTQFGKTAEDVTGAQAVGTKSKQ